LSPDAANDLREIARFIGSADGFDNPFLARKVVNELRAACQAIGRRPRLYQMRAEFGPDMRRALCGRYLIIYRERANEVRIERILHSARDIVRVLRRPQSPPRS
jgi:plasmid stabilization system protein ParE